MEYPGEAEGVIPITSRFKNITAEDIYRINDMYLDEIMKKIRDRLIW